MEKGTWAIAHKHTHKAKKKAQGHKNNDARARVRMHRLKGKDMSTGTLERAKG